MWRRRNLPGNPDSESISEEEEEHINISLAENDKFPSENAKEEEGGLLLQTKLEKLIGYGEINYPRESGDVSLESTLRKISSSHEDDVEVPDSPDQNHFVSSRRADKTCISAQESGSDDEISDMAEDFEPAADLAIEEDPITDCPNEVERSEKGQSIAGAELRDVLHGWTEDAIPKPVNIPPDKSRVIQRNFKPYSRRKGKSLKFTHKRSSLNLQDSATGDELPGPMDSGSSSDDELSYQRSVPNISNQKKQYVGDRFDEAIKASSLSKEGLLFGSPKLSGGSNLYSKLQQIMKQEKETEMEITKKLQGGIGQADASSYVDVKIMSRHLEGKLVVCKCSVIDLSMDSLLLKNTETTIIFSPKLCADVDIEMGNFIRLYAPWKEMEVKNTNEVIILSSYFSSM